MARFRAVQIANDGLPEPPDMIEQFARAGVDLLVADCRSRADLERHAGDADLVWVYGGRRILLGDNLDAIPRCGAIVRSGSGTDNIDIAGATARGILVCNTPDAVADQVADHAIGLLFDLVRHISFNDRRVRRGVWDNSRPLPHRRFDGAALGLVGFGRIPQRMVRKLAGFGMTVRAYDPYVPAAKMQAVGVQPATLDEVFASSDYVSVHTPLTEETRRLVTEHHFRLMQKHALFVNTSRGPVVEESALIQALSEGWIAGAALDVLEQEPIRPDHPFLRMEQVVLTPHSAGTSDRGFIEYYEVSFADIVALSQHRWPSSVVNPQVKPRWTDMPPRA
jgi:D-3-phosphoglycerate dehydrogenase / 2-oxoglutarate reductase